MSQKYKYPIYRKSDNIFIQINEDQAITACLINLKYLYFRFDDKLKLSNYDKNLQNQMLDAVGIFEKCLQSEFDLAKNCCLLALNCLTMQELISNR